MSWMIGHHENIGWRRGGRGEPVVLLRGLGRWHDHWCGFDDLLAAYYDVICIDNPGFGLSRNKQSSWFETIDDVADRLAMVLQKIAAKPVQLVGVSLGGMIAMNLAARHPTLITKLILVNSSVGGSPYPRLTPTAMKALAKALVQPKRFYEALAHALLSPQTSEATRKRLQDEWSRIDRQYGLNPRSVLKQLLAASRFRGLETMAKIACPTLVVQGGSDQFVDPRNSEWIAQHIASCQRAVCSNGGHELGLDQPQWLLQEIQTFLGTRREV